MNYPFWYFCFSVKNAFEKSSIENKRLKQKLEKRLGKGLEKRNNICYLCTRFARETNGFQESQRVKC
jgi:hypothetical protein